MPLPKKNMSADEILKVAAGADAADVVEEVGTELGPQAGIDAHEMRKGRPANAKNKKRFKLPDAMKVLHEAYRVRVRSARVKAGLKGDDAVDWARGKLQDMAPEAIAEVQWALRYGDAKARQWAAELVAEANGIAKKEHVQGSAGMVVLNLNGSLDEAPFLKRSLEASPVTTTPRAADGDAPEGGEE